MPAERRSTTGGAVSMGQGTQIVSRRVIGDWAVILTMGEVDGRGVVTELRVLPAGVPVPALAAAEDSVETLRHYGAAAEDEEHCFSGGLTTRFLRSLPLASMAEEAWRDYQREKHHLEENPDSGWVVSLYGVRISEEQSRRLNEARNADASLALNALLYTKMVAAGETRPAVEMAKIFGVSSRAIQTRLARARDRGLLTRPKSRSAGGGLTEKAREILSGIQGTYYQLADKDGLQADRPSSEE